MPTGSAFLDRLRPVGTPGAAARRGVPADRLAEFGAELEPLFELLAETEVAAGKIRRVAEDDAGRMVTNGMARAEAVIADATERAEAVRADTAARGRTEAAAEEALLVRTAAEGAERLRARVTTDISDHVARAVESASAELHAVAGSAEEPGAVASPGDSVRLGRVWKRKP